MPCKHEGGKDPCERYKNGNCRKDLKAYWKEYAKSNVRGSGFAGSTGRNQTDSGEAGELFVAVDLLKRGLSVTKPLNRSVKDDLHVRCGKRWFSIQSKVASVNHKTGTIIAARYWKKPITSDIVAWVDLSGMRIRYQSNSPRPLPKELL